MIYFETFSVPTADTLFLLILSILTLESAHSIRFLYQHFLSGITEKSLNVFYYACSYILSITVGANETSKFWLGMLNDLKNRGVKDVLFFCVDGLPGFKEAIQAVYPQAEIQRCVIHMLRNSFKYVNYNDLKKFSSDFKEVYNAPNETAALTELENMKEKWGKKYPYAISNWENNWEDVSSFFQFSNDIRRIMYTTNIIEGLNRQYRKVTKTKSVFPSDSALEKMLYLASENVVKKWTQRYRNWDQVLNQLIVLYGERLTAYL